MWPVFWILAAALCLWGIVYLLKKSRGIPVLSVTVATGDGFIFEVSFEKLHPEFNSVEYIHLILHSAAKFLYIIPRSKREQAIDFLSYIELLGDIELEASANILSFCGRAIIANEYKSDCQNYMRATLFYKDVMRRNISTSIPLAWFENQFLNAWLALVQTTLPKLNAVLLSKLQCSLNRMSAIYNVEGVDFSAISALMNVPNRAFVEMDLDIT
jgi:hypothetical protein